MQKVKITDENGKYYFDKKSANRILQFFDKYIVHVKGKWAGKKFKLENWQKEILTDIFGWKKKSDGTRRFRKVYLEIPKKNGKSALASGVGLYLTVADSEIGAEVYSAATDKDQAKIVFDTAKRMLSYNKKLKKFARPVGSRIVVDKTGSYYQVLSREVASKHGYNSHGIIFDELHAQKTRELWDVLTVGSSVTRKQPLLFTITTAGWDKTSICYEQHDYAMKIINGTIKNDSFYAVIYSADPEDDWTKEKTWYKANPNLGVSISIEEFKSLCEEAQQKPALENLFKRLHLNIWTSQSSRWIRMSDWDKCNRKYDVNKLRNRLCYVGMDLSSTIDLACTLFAFPFDDDNVVLLPYFFMPNDSLPDRVKRDKVPYDVWARQGYIYLTSGSIIDYREIRSKILASRNILKYNIQEIAYDPWNATEIVNNLTDDGFKMIPMRQGFQTMSPPTKEFERRILAGKILHNNNPVLRWMVDNTQAIFDSNKNIRLDKSKSTGRIDGVIASIMALDRIVRTKSQESVYKNRGIRTI